MPYAEAATLQAQLADEVRDGRRPHTLLFVEHDPVLTLGANFHAENLLLSEEGYAQRGIRVERTDRGGDVTYHGPGQLVIYPIFHLEAWGKDLHVWLRSLEEVVIQALERWEIPGERFAPHTGVWTGGRKIAAIGIKVRRWVNLHGIALNCDNDLAPFGWIVPCGIHQYGVTSLTQELDRPVGVPEARETVLRAFEAHFDLSLEPVERDVS